MKYKLDPRTLLCIVGVISTIAVITRYLWVQFILLGLLVCLALLFQVRLKRFLYRIRKMFPILVFVILMQSIFTQGQPLVGLGNISLLTLEGILLGMKTFLRISILIMGASLFTLTSETEMIQALRQMKLPDEIAFMTLISLRFLPSYAQEFQDAFLAISLRGIDLKQLSLKRKAELLKYLFSPTMVRTLLRAKRLSMSLDLKGFRALPSRSSYIVCELKKIDYIVFVMMTIVLLFWIGIEWRVI